MLTDSSAGPLAGPTDSTDPAGLQLERLPNGELAWLRQELDAAIRDADRDLTRYWITDRGRDLLRRERALAELFDPGWPTVAEARALGWVA